jgi:uncharacterized protein YbgA (DUF1722 family)
MASDVGLNLESTASGVRPLYVSIEIAANLLYLARHTEDNLERQRYLERASDVLLGLRGHHELIR